jgi:uncharacterized protein with PIN domain
MDSLQRLTTLPKWLRFLGFPHTSTSTEVELLTEFLTVKVSDFAPTDTKT